MLFHHAQKPHHHGLCLVFHLLAAGLLLFTTIAAFFGVYLSHIDVDGLLFGSPEGSLAILAFVVSLSLWLKHMKECVTPCDVCATMPVAKKSGKK